MTLRLHLQEATIRLQAAHAAAVVLPLSLDDLLAAGLERFPPRAAALEQAIQLTEDALMPAIPALRQPPATLLECADPVLAPLLPATGRDAGATATLSIAEVEEVFDRLARVAAGVPAHSLGLPAHPGFAAALVVVRELLHHVGLAALRVMPAAD
ncbi:hypothetical protein [Stenotrophomonas acidaminiphila]